MNRTLRLPLLTALMAPAAALWAQCPFTPDVTPGMAVLCAGDSAVLTTEVYDTYQWYKNANPIPGATGQTLVVHSEDSGNLFRVAATSEGCTEFSPYALVDGWVFLLPYVINGGDEPITSGPILEFCEGDTLTLTLATGYTENITWYNNGAPMPGENSPTLVVTSSGSYTVTAANATCPNLVMGIGVDIGVHFLATLQPTIVLNGDQLCVYPVGNSTQWYLDGQPAGTTDCITFTSSGPYTAFVDYGEPCQGLSDPWFATNVGETLLPAPGLSPVPASSLLTIQWPEHMPASVWQLLDPTGRPLRTGTTAPGNNEVLDLHGLAPGNYLLAPLVPAWQPQRVVVVR